jgi:hypothetical protein
LPQVLFGDTIQLQHVKSGKFLSKMDERTQSGHLRVLLVDDATKYSWFTCLPRNASAVRLGGRITSSDPRPENVSEVVICMHGFANQFLHCEEPSDAHSSASKKRACSMNVSLEKTIWRIRRFAPFVPVGEQSVRVGDYVYIHDPLAMKTLRMLSESEAKMLALVNEDGGGGGGGAAADLSASSFAEQEVADAMADVLRLSPFMQQDCFEEKARSESLHCGSLFLLQGADPISGGPVDLMAAPPALVFRHVNSGRYLCMSSDGRHLLTTENRESKGVRFSVAPLTNSRLLKDNTGVHLTNGESFLGAGRLVDVGGESGGVDPKQSILSEAVMTGLKDDRGTINCFITRAPLDVSRDAQFSLYVHPSYLWGTGCVWLSVPSEPAACAACAGLLRVRSCCVWGSWVACASGAASGTVGSCVAADQNTRPSPCCPLPADAPHAHRHGRYRPPFAACHFVA